MKKSVQLFLLIVCTAVLLSSCLPRGYDGAAHTAAESVSEAEAAEKPAGFFLGIWHGWLAPVSLVVSLFQDTVRIYEVNNTGWWYDFGYYIAIISGFGGISLVRKKKRSEHYKD